MPGRPRKPKKLHILDGSFRKDRHSADVEADGIPIKPATLRGDAGDFWDAVVPGLVKSGIAKACDAAALTLLCQWWQRYLRFSRALDRVSPIYKNSQRLVRLVDVASKWFDRIGSRFGLTPADRAKMRTQEQPRADPFTLFLGRKKAGKSS
jgi:P27 family predicted phage terminase small subunit